MSLRYRRFAPALRSEAAYQELSAPAPNGRTLLEWLITGDCTGIIPGLFCAGRLAIMEQLGWDAAPEEDQRRVWEEVLRSGYLRYDPKTRLCWLPALVEDTYLPDQPNTLKGWAKAWAELPECELKHEAWRALSAYFEARTPRHAAQGDKDRSTAFAQLFVASCPEPRRGSGQPARESQNEPQSEARPERTQRASKRGSPGGSLQDQDQHQRTDPGSGGVSLGEPRAQGAPPAPEAPTPKTAPSAAEQHLELGRRSMARFQAAPADSAPNRFQVPNWKPLVLEALRALARGGKGGVSLPGRGAAIALDPTTLDQLYSIFCATGPTDEEMETIGVIWLEGTYFRSREQKAPDKPKQLTPQWIASDRPMFIELLGLAQTRLRDGAPQITGPMASSTRSKFDRLSGGG